MNVEILSEAVTHSELSWLLSSKLSSEFEILLILLLVKLIPYCILFANIKEIMNGNTVSVFVKQCLCGLDGWNIRKKCISRMVVKSHATPRIIYFSWF